jgi:proteasome lid subunit RPN8/RPN11
MLNRLRSEMLACSEETCAILFGRAVEVDGKLARIIVRESREASASSYEIRTSTRAQLRPEFVAEAAQRARQSKESVIFVHTHPFAMNHFSSIDDDGEKKLQDFFAQRVPCIAHAAMLITPEATIARELGKKEALEVVAIGPDVTFGQSCIRDEQDNQYDRQIRAFGKEGQSILKRLRVAIVGLGGTGSVVLQELAHLGVSDFVLLDPDVIEETNLNRLVGSGPDDIGASKVELAKKTALRINPNSKVSARQQSVLSVKSTLGLADVDFIFGCTDSHGSRAVLNQFAYQYLVPTIDMGVVIATSKNKVSHVAARTQMLAPGIACLVCGNLLDAEEIRRDMLTEFERQEDPYILGDAEPAPAVISLNATIASMAVTMFLNSCTDIPGSARFLNYNAITGTTRPAMCAQHPSCIVCSPSGALARGGEWPIPGRID